MGRVVKSIFLCVAIGLVLVTAVVFLIRVQNTPPTFSVQQLSTPVPTLTAADVENLLGRKFRIVRNVRQVPSVVKQDFSSFSSQQFEMVNPGREMSTDDILPNVPNKRLVFAAFSDDTAVLVFEQGGFANIIHVVVFWYAKGRGRWGAMLKGYSVHDIDSLRSAVHMGQFVSWENIPGWLRKPPDNSIGSP